MSDMAMDHALSAAIATFKKSEGSDPDYKQVIECLDRVLEELKKVQDTDGDYSSDPEKQPRNLKAAGAKAKLLLLPAVEKK